VDDPLNAIENAAVTSQTTIQYMNISQINYVALSRETREFLIANNFHVYMEDEMIEVIRQENPFVESLAKLFPIVLLAAVTLLLASSYVIARRLKRAKEMPSPLTKG
jgi:hypothetical protein